MIQDPVFDHQAFISDVLLEMFAAAEVKQKKILAAYQNCRQTVGGIDLQLYHCQAQLGQL